MPRKCYICNYHDPKTSLFRIPDRNDEYSDRCGLWLKLLEEKSENANQIRICSKHFLNKNPAKSGDYLNVDWVPSRNLGRFAKNRKHIDYYYRTKKRQQPEEYLSRMKINDSYEQGIRSDINNTVEFNTTNNRQTKATDGNQNCLNLCNELATENTIAINEAGANHSQPNETNGDTESFDWYNELATGGLNLFNQTGAQYVDPTATKSNLNLFIESGTNVDGNNLTTNSSITNNVQCTTEKTSKKEVFLYTTTAVVPLKKRRIDIEKLAEKIFLPKDIQTDLTSEDVDLIFKYYKEAVEERNQLLMKISTLVIDVDFFKENDKKTRFYTGLTTWPLLKNFFEMVEDALPTHFNCKLSKFQMVVLTLMKLRLNLSFTDLGYRFQVEVSTASRYFHRCLYIFFKLFDGSKLIYWPDEREHLLSNIPSYFQSTFKNQITVIVDCFEIFIERPSNLMAAAQAFSQYKHHITLKYLIGISITGAIIFISRGFGGRASDKKVSTDSGFINRLKEGDLVLADKGFLIEEEVEDRGAFLRIPCFVKNKSQLDPHEVEQSRYYSSIRIHVERLISVLREKFNICSDVAQMSAVSKHNDLFNKDLYDKIVFVCGCLVNLCPSVVSSDFEM